VTGNGGVTGTPGSIKCPSACSATVDTGTVFSLTAKANSGYAFVNWDGACQGTASTCSVTLDSSATVAAIFKPLYNVSVGLNGKGTVVSNPSGIGCGLKSGSSCSSKFVQGTSVTFTATPDPGSTWTGWAGACSGTSLTCTIAVNADTSIQASFR